LALGHSEGPGFRRAAGHFPSFATVLGPLDELPEPAAALRGVNAVRVGGRTFEMIHFPAGKMRAGHLPVLTLAIRGENERALLCANEDSYFAHVCSGLCSL